MLLSPEICHIYDATQSSKNHALSDPPNRTDPTAAAQTDDQCSAWQCSAENRAIPKNAKTAHRQTASAARMTPVLAHLLLDRIQHHSDWMRVAECEID